MCWLHMCTRIMPLQRGYKHDTHTWGTKKQLHRINSMNTEQLENKCVNLLKKHKTIGCYEAEQSTQTNSAGHNDEEEIDLLRYKRYRFRRERQIWSSLNLVANFVGIGFRGKFLSTTGEILFIRCLLKAFFVLVGLNVEECFVSIFRQRKLPLTLQHSLKNLIDSGRDQFYILLLLGSLHRWKYFKYFSN